MKKVKWISIFSFMILVMIFTSKSQNTYAADGDFTVVDGVLTKYTGSDTNVVIPEGVTSIDDVYKVFGNTDSITCITIPSSLTKLENNTYNDKHVIFSDWQNLKEIIVDENNTEYSSVDGVLYNKDKTKLLFCPNGYDGVLDIPNTVSTISAYSFGNYPGAGEEGEYRQNFNVTTIKIPSSVVNIEESGYPIPWTVCDKIQNVVVDSNNPVFSSNDGALYNKEQTCLLYYPNTKTTFEIPATVNTIGSGAVYYCNFTELIITSSIKNINSFAFGHLNQDTTPLNELIIPSTVKNIDLHAFYNSKIKNVNIEEGITSIPFGMFGLCDDLENVTIQEGITSIGDNAFYGCTNLKTVTIPQSVKSIGGGAFYFCSDAIIKGYTGSYAETYAYENNMNFESIGGQSKSQYDDVKIINWDSNSSALSIEEMQQIIEINKTKDIKLVTNGVVMLFKKGEMKLIDGINSYDFGVGLETSRASINSDKITYNNFVLSVIFKYSGNLPAEATVSIPVGVGYAGKTLYYYLNNNGQLELVQSGVVSDDGYLTVQQSHCSDYIILTEDINASGTGADNASHIKDATPKTGELINIKYLICIGLLFIGLGLLLYKRQAVKNCNSKNNLHL